MTVLHKCRLCNAEDWQNVITWIFPLHANFILHVFYAVISFQMLVTMCPSDEKLRQFLFPRFAKQCATLTAASPKSQDFDKVRVSALLECHI